MGPIKYSEIFFITAVQKDWNCDVELNTVFPINELTIYHKDRLHEILSSSKHDWLHSVVSSEGIGWARASAKSKDVKFVWESHGKTWYL